MNKNQKAVRLEARKNAVDGIGRVSNREIAFKLRPPLRKHAKVAYKSRTNGDTPPR